MRGFATLFRAIVVTQILFASTRAWGQSSSDKLWQDQGTGAAYAAIQPLAATAQPWVQPSVCRVHLLDAGGMRNLLASSHGPAIALAGAAPVVSLPMPDGSYQKFRVRESSIMEPPLAAQFPEIQTYEGQGLDDPSASARIDFTPAGFHAQILSNTGAVYVDPWLRNNDTTYASYYVRDYHPGKQWSCGVQELAPTKDTDNPMAPTQLLTTGSTLRTYRLACAATGEYTQFQGGTVAAGMAAITTTVNRVVGIYQRELAIKLVLVANNSSIVYTNASTDPYSNTDANSLLTQNQSNLNSVIGNSNYDIGHVVGTGGGGLAALGVVCSNGSKAQGETGSSNPTGDGFDVDYVAHEMGHQFGANHTFNGYDGNCSGNRASTAAYEPGSGTTIMAYAGICGADDLQAHSDPFFHSRSLEEISTYVASKSCATTAATGNTAPTVNAGADFSIPQNTPFMLTATGSDADNEAVTFCWEQRDLGVQRHLSDPDNGSSPLFRAFAPVSVGTRTFPKYSAILTNTSSLGEILPTTTRSLHFRVTARDNRATGGTTNSDDAVVNVVSTAGPFRVTAPNTAVSWSGNQTVTWSVAGTTASPISTASVSILLSTDGGNTFPTVLIASTPNDGSEAVTLPSLSSTTARIKVQPVGNIYFDISDVNFTIVLSQPVKPDFDHDGDVDDTDFAHFDGCMVGADIISSITCPDARLDADTDVDQSDFGIFQRCISGVGIAPIPTCAN